MAYFFRKKIFGYSRKRFHFLKEVFVKKKGFRNDGLNKKSFCF